ncbi:hypothetical protein LHY41_004694 [Salmonella enterica]|nr:hypothetical protein [Salmonella enterica subsp. diarizonae]EII9568360.1 hypothetical protein [Salmonella enterica]
MSDDNTEHDFAWVEDTLNQITRTLSQEPCAQLLQRPLIHRSLSNISDALNKKHCPEAHEVDALIRTLRNEKFRYIREYGHSSVITAEIQILITSLKKVRYFLQLSEPEAQYYSNVDTRLRENKKNTIILFSALAFVVFCLSLILSFFDLSPLPVYTVGIVLCFPLSFSWNRCAVFCSLSCVTLFTLLALAYTYLH